MTIKRKRNKRGRPSADVEREPNGRKKRNPKPQEDMCKVAIDARQRVYGIPEEQAKHEKAGTVLGRLWLSGAITTEQREAGEKYLELYNAAMRAINAPDGLAVSDSGGSSGDVVTDEYIAWAIKAVERYEVMKAAIHDLSPYAIGLVEWVVVNDLGIGLEPMPALQRELNILAAKMGISK